MKKSLAFSLFLFLVALGSACDTGGDANKQTVEQAPMVIAANEMAALSRLRSIVAAEQNYFAETAHYGSLEDLIKSRAMADPSSGKLTGYKFTVQSTSAGFEVSAVPEKYGITGKRSFYVDQSNVTRAADKKGASASNEDPEV